MVYRKGQLSFDFYAALIMFVALIAYITFQLFQIVPANASGLDDESVRIEAYQLSEILVNDRGEPTDWETKPLAEIKRIGLSDSSQGLTNYLSNSKLTRFKSLCTNYNDIRTLLDITEEAGFTIVEHKPTGDEVFNSCKSIEAKRTSFSVSRTVFITGTTYPTEITVEVWRK